MDFKLLTLCVFALWTVSAASEDQVHYNNYKLFATYPKTQAQNDFLVKLKGDFDLGVYGNDKMEVWGHPEKGVSSDPILILSAPEFHSQLIFLLNMHAIKYEVTIENVEQTIMRERSGTRSSTKMHWSEYQRYDVIEAWILAMGKINKDIFKLEVLGKTYEGRNIYMFTIGKPRADGKTKPAIWMDSNIHAREFISSATLTFILNEIFTKYGQNDPTVKKMVDEVDWYVVPVMNPDGLEHAHTRERMWRRTRKVNPFNDCAGADPNRNYDHQWMRSGSDQSPCGQVFAGPYPFSEVETLLTTDKFLELNKNGQIKCLMTIHSFSQVWLTPWGYALEYPTDYQDLVKLGQDATAALKAVHGTSYRTGSSTALLGAAAGATDDWGKAKGGAKYSYTVELRDTGRYGFLLPPQQIKPTGEETFAAVAKVANIIIEEYPAW